MALFAISALVSAGGCGGEEFSQEGNGASGGTDSGEPPENVEGEYTVALTNRKNTCASMSEGWVEGAMSTGIPFVITQDGVELQAETMGVAAIGFVLLTGTNLFEGEIHGSHFVLVNYGTKTNTVGNCTYTINATVEGDVHGDSIAGTLIYAPAISNNPDCAEYDCAVNHDFSGSRPPT